VSEDPTEAVRTTRDYYNSRDADQFYLRVWGGEDIHVGIYESEDDSIVEASRRTVSTMASLIPDLCDDAAVLDIGSGYGGAARFMAARGDLKVDCLNLSVVQNERNRDLTRAQSLEGRVRVYEGSFEALPFAAGTYDIVWSQDALLHSGSRIQVFGEVDRVLKASGHFIFTDIMQRHTCLAESLRHVYERIGLTSMGSFEFYRETARSLGWEPVRVTDLSPQLVEHYSRVHAEVVARHEELQEHCSGEYLANMERGLMHWVEAAREGNITWGIFHFRKP